MRFCGAASRAAPLLIGAAERTKQSSAPRAGLHSTFVSHLAKLEGVTDEHVATLRKASTTTASRSNYPYSDDSLRQAAYTAAALRGLAEAVATLQGNATKPTAAVKRSEA
jgi:hypothetical protein